MVIIKDRSSFLNDTFSYFYWSICAWWFVWNWNFFKVSISTVYSHYWEFQYNDGRVIPGSSGSPMFNQNKRQVGIASYIYTNYCDPSPDCYCSQQYNHGYGRFDQAWNMGLSQYLDPINSGVSFIDGIGIVSLLNFEGR